MFGIPCLLSGRMRTVDILRKDMVTSTRWLRFFSQHPKTFPYISAETVWKTPFYYPTKKGKLHYAGVRVGACKAQFTVSHLCLFFVCFCIYIYCPPLIELNVGHHPFVLFISAAHFVLSILIGLFLFHMSYNVPCLIFLNMFCIVLYAYTLICLYICLKWTHFITTAMFLTSHFSFRLVRDMLRFRLPLECIFAVCHFRLLHYACFKWEFPSNMPYWICVEWQKSVQLGNIFQMFIT